MGIFVLILVCLCGFQPFAWAAKAGAVAKGAVTCRIKGVQTGHWDPSQREMIAITYQVHNHDATKKLEVLESAQYTLNDEYKNNYRFLSDINGYPGPADIKPKSFPSLYPNDAYTKTVFFEAPIPSSQRLTLVIAGLIDPERSLITLPIDLKKWNYGKVKVVIPPGVQITSPFPGSQVYPGQSVEFAVDVDNTDGLKMIVVQSLGQQFEDQNPRKHNMYHINVPQDQAQGNFDITVIGHWVSPDKDREEVVSDSIFLEVAPARRTYY